MYGPVSTIRFVVLVLDLASLSRPFSPLALSLSFFRPSCWRSIAVKPENTHRSVMRIRSFTQGIPVPTFEMHQVRI